MMDKVLASKLVGGEHIIAAGPLTKQPNTLPYRIVIRVLGDEYVVCMQCFFVSEWDDLYEACKDAENYFGNGSYCDTLEEALERFVHSLNYHRQYIPSIYRELRKRELNV